MIYEDKKLVKRHAEYNGIATNNRAEYRAVLLALEWCSSNLDVKESSFVLYSDNELVVRQINGRYKIRSKTLKPMNSGIKRIIEGFRDIEFKNVRRENMYISAVDRSLNSLLDAVEGQGAR